MKFLGCDQYRPIQQWEKMTHGRLTKLHTDHFSLIPVTLLAQLPLQLLQNNFDCAQCAGWKLHMSWLTLCTKLQILGFNLPNAVAGSFWAQKSH